MKLSDFKGEDALDVLAEIISPVTEILNDGDIKNAWQSNRDLASCCELALKKHRKAMITVLATTQQKTYEEYMKTVTVFSVPLHLAELASDEVLLNFFLPPPLMKEVESFGGATEITTEEAQEDS